MGSLPAEIAPRIQELKHMHRRTFLKGTLATAALPCFWTAGAENTPPVARSKYILSAPLTHSDWMLKPNITWGPEGVQHMLDQCKECGWSRIYWRGVGGGGAFYKSKMLKPKGEWGGESFLHPPNQADRAF